MPRTMVWTFSRRQHRLEIRRETTPDGAVLVVVGGDAPGAMAFRDMSALIDQQSRLEARLLDAGWSLVAFEPERRSHAERRAAARGSLDRRRWWTDSEFRRRLQQRGHVDGAVEVMVRPEAAGDYAAIRALNEAAFGRGDEADLIDRLRRDGAVLAAFAAELDRQIVGHVLFSRLRIESASDVRAAVALAPMAVSPAQQGRSIGAQLIQHGLACLHDAGEEIVIVLGHADYYPRFGFSSAKARALGNSFPPGALMALELVPHALAGVSGVVRYPAAFGL